jgi:hypothetical protein
MKFWAGTLFIAIFISAINYGILMVFECHRRRDLSSEEANNRNLKQSLLLAIILTFLASVLFIIAFYYQGIGFNPFPE